MWPTPLITSSVLLTGCGAPLDWTEDGGGSCRFHGDPRAPRCLRKSSRSWRRCPRGSSPARCDPWRRWSIRLWSRHLRAPCPSCWCSGLWEGRPARTWCGGADEWRGGLGSWKMRKGRLSGHVENCHIDFKVHKIHSAKKTWWWWRWIVIWFAIWPTDVCVGCFPPAPCVFSLNTDLCALGLVSNYKNLLFLPKRKLNLFENNQRVKTC